MRRSRIAWGFHGSCGLALSLLLAIAKSASAQGWQSLSPAIQPGNLRGASMSYDLRASTTVLFGGVDASGLATNATWTWDGEIWSQAQPAHAPSSRHGHAMAYDRRRGSVVLYGGMTLAGMSDETWEWDGADWAHSSTASRPTARADAAVCYDAVRGRIALFGGRSATGQSLADAWTWSDGRWSPVVTTALAAQGPSARHGAVFLHDAVRGLNVLFGGNDGVADLGDTWTFDGRTWRIVPTTFGPSARSFAAGLSDDGAALAMLVGGISNGAPVADCWSWVGNGWLRAQGQLPSPRGQAAAAVDFGRSRLQVFGGQGAGGVLGDVVEAGSGSERTMVGQTLLLPGNSATFTYAHPSSAAGNLYCHLIAPRSRGVESLALPGLSLAGRLHVDLQTAAVAALGTLDASGSMPWTVSVPFHPALIGSGFDFQSLDVHPATQTVFFADNDLEATVVFAAQATVPTMVSIPAGTFSMGSTAIGGVSAPVRQVTISTPFSIGRYEVTQAEFRSVMGSNPSFHQGSAFPGAAGRPVDAVTWQAAMAYCAALNAIESAAGRVPAGMQYRLPTEAEWEYCCRAGSTTEWSVGGSLACAQANHAPAVFVQCQPGTVAAGSYGANSFGVFDMHGNVAEWCLDGWDGTANYTGTTATNPYVATGPLRILRGGGWTQSPDACRSAARSTALPTMTTPAIGFRVVLGPVRVP